MLEYVAAANAAYSVIRKAVENGKELTSVAKHIAKFTDATEHISETKNKKKNSIWSKFTGKQENDLDEFFALEDLKKKEEELKQLMIYLGRPGLHADYVRFCVEARKRRKREAAEKRKRAAELVETIQTGLYVFLGVAAALLITFVVVQYFK
jgi:hypothetical protein|tara:strand:- start:63 stop:518 length:456 start_codon:yes stop_codon:yes gene_type:complete